MVGLLAPRLILTPKLKPARTLNIPSMVSHFNINMVDHHHIKAIKGILLGLEVLPTVVVHQDMMGTTPITAIVVESILIKADRKST